MDAIRRLSQAVSVEESVGMVWVALLSVEVRISVRGRVPMRMREKRARGA